MLLTGARDVEVVVFTDLVGSTAFRQAHGSEAAEALQQAVDDAHTDLAGAHGGHIVKHLGDGMMLIFRSASGALSFASGLHAEMVLLSRQLAADVQLRIGVSIGEVVANDGDVFGMAPIEAARLCALAKPQQALIADDVVRALRGTQQLAVQNPQPYDCKGIDEPVVAWDLRWGGFDVRIPLPPELTGDPRFRFVGRDDDLAALDRARRMSHTGTAKCSVVVGAAGLGKTRLVAEVAQRAHDDGALVLFGRHDEDVAVPYQALAAALQRFLAEHPTATLARRLGRRRGELRRLVPELGTLISGLPPMTDGDPDVERLALHHAVADWIGELCAIQPVVLVIDDIQWSGPPTMTLLRHLLTELAAAPLWVIATSRVPLTTAPLSLLQAPNGTLETIDLMPFDGATTQAFLERAAGHPLGDDGRRAAEFLLRQSGGNPFFLREITLDLFEQGAFAQVDGRWRAVIDFDGANLPVGVHRVVTDRVARLGDDAQRVLSWAAVVGLQFDIGLLGAVTDTDVDALLDTLEPCIDAGILREEGVDSFAFSHLLVRQSLYDAMSATRRVRAHRRVAATIEAMDDVPRRRLLGTLAHHADLGRMGDEDPTRVIHYRRMAGEQALQQLSATVAVTHLERALELYDVQGTALADPAGRVEVTIALGRALLDAGSPRFESVMLDAIDQANALQHGALLGTALMAMAPSGGLQTGSVVADRLVLLEQAIAWMNRDDSPLLARLLATTAAELHFSGDIARIQALADEALAMARRVGDDAALRDVLGLRLTALRFPALVLVRRSDAIELYRSALAAGDTLNAFTAAYRQFDAEMEVGDGDAARRCAAQLDALYAQQPRPVLELLHERIMIETLLLDGHLAQAADLLELTWTRSESFGLSRQRQASRTSLSEKIYTALGRADLAVEAWAPLMRPEYFALSGSGLGPAVALMDAGDLQRAAELYRVAADDRFASVGITTSTANLLAFAATLCFQFGTNEDADLLHELLMPFEPFVAKTAGAAGSVQYFLGLLDLCRDDVAGALRRFDAASAQHTRLGAPVLEGYNQVARAVALTRRGAPGDDAAVAAILDDLDDLIERTGAVGLRQRLALWLAPEEGTPA